MANPKEKLSIQERISLLSVVEDVVDDCNDKLGWAKSSLEGYIKQKAEAAEGEWYDYNEKWLKQAQFKVDVWEDVINYLIDKY